MPKRKPVKPKTPAPPAWLGTDAKRKWREVYPLLAARGLTERLDHDQLALYCDCWQQLHDANKTIKRQGEYFETEKGYIGIHPAVLKRRKAVDVMRKIAEQLGLTPKARKTLNVADPTPAGDPLQAFLEKRPRG